MSDDASGIFSQIDDGMANGFLFLTGINSGQDRDAGDASASSAASATQRRCMRRWRTDAADVDDAQRRVFVQRVGPASVECLPVVVLQQPTWISTATTLTCNSLKLIESGLIGIDFSC